MRVYCWQYIDNGGIKYEVSQNPQLFDYVQNKISTDSPVHLELDTTKSEITVKGKVLKHSFVVFHQIPHGEIYLEPKGSRSKQ